LPGPINRKRDFGKTLPPTGSREPPPDADVAPWAEAIEHERDPYMRLLVLCILQFGWRPENQVGRLKWRNVRYDPQGRPCAIVARGTEEGFKSASAVVAHLPADVVDALAAWKEKSPNVSPDARIFPWRGVTGT